MEETIPEDAVAASSMSDSLEERGSQNFGIGAGRVSDLGEQGSDDETPEEELSWDDYIKTVLMEYGGLHEAMIISLGVGVCSC